VAPAPVAIGDIENDGLPDTLAGALGTNSASIFLTGGASQIATGNTVSQFGTGVAWLGDLNGDGFGDFLVGDPNTVSGGSVGVLLGGPTAAKNDNFGPGCGNPFTPQLSLSAGLRINSNQLVTLNAVSSGGGFFLAGMPNPVGTPMPPPFGSGCTLWLQSSGMTSSFFLTSTGSASFPVTVPANVSLLGMVVGFQVAFHDNIFNTDEMSNAVTGLVGW
jgi:hypothetical protein